MASSDSSMKSDETSITKMHKNLSEFDIILEQLLCDLSLDSRCLDHQNS